MSETELNQPTKLPRPGQQSGWLAPPPGVSFGDIDAGSHNPFIRYRKFLWSYRFASQNGLDDQGFVRLVERINAAVAEVDADGTGFEITPFSEIAGLGSELSPQPSRLPSQVFVKDETGNVAGSHKARHLFGLGLHLEVQEVPQSQPLAIASCGNAARAAAVVAKALGRPLDVYVPTTAPDDVLAELDRLGAKVQVCERRADEVGDPSYLRFKEALLQGAMAFSVQAVENIFALEGGKCLGWELAEATAGADAEQSAALFVQIGGGALASSVLQGLVEACDLGVLKRLPALYAVQTEGCAPLARALRLILDQTSGTDDFGAALAAAEANPEQYMWPWEQLPESIATGILDDQTYDWLPIVWGMLATRGGAPVVSEELLQQATDLAQSQVSSKAGPTGASALAGLLSLSLPKSDVSSPHSVLVDAEQELPDRAIVLVTGRT